MIMKDMFENFEIMIDAPASLEKARQLKDIASELDQTEKNIKKQIGLIEQYWKGSAGDTIRDKLSYTDKINRTLIDDLNNTACRIESIVNAIEELDKASKQRIRNMER